MVTKVGMQNDFSSAVKDLVELDYDAIEAYDSAIRRLENVQYKEELKKFKQDHERHVAELSNLLRAHQEKAPTGPSGKQWLTKGKVIIANIVGDMAILAAMKSNEGDTNTAYERMHKHEHQWADAVEIINRGLLDEKKHKAWLNSILQS